MKYPYIRYMMQRKIVHMQYLPTLEHIAYIYTKQIWLRMPFSLRGSIDDSIQDKIKNTFV
jgi:hypothetical protein